MGNRWDEVRLIPDSTGYAQLPYSGWFLMLGWAAGPERMGRCRGSIAEAFAATPDLGEEQGEGLRAATDEYLGLAGIPPVPEGYLWFLEMPARFRSEQVLWARVARLMRDRIGVLAGRLSWSKIVAAQLPMFEDVVATLYCGRTSRNPPCGS